MKIKALILCKTYPEPSEGYIETTCVAAITPDKKLIRLFPIPFRYMAKEQVFKKWQWIEVDTITPKKDSRIESHQVMNITSLVTHEFLDTSKNWLYRMQTIEGSKIYTSFDDLYADHQKTRMSLAFFKPLKIIGLEIEKDKPHWTEDEIAKLKGQSKQDTLDLGDDMKKALNAPLLQKIPFKFRYIYEYEHEGQIKQGKHIIKDWEIGMLYLHCRSKYKDDWQKYFRQKLEVEFLSKDMLFLMGNMKAVPKQWMIISLIYPPKQPKPACVQESLF